MADADVQGMLINIEATTAQLRQELARGDAAVSQTAGKMDANLGRIDSAFDRTGANASALQQAVSSAFNGISLASAGAVAGLVAITAKTAQYAQEVRNLSSLANASTSEFQRIAAGAKTVGVEQEKLSDILKDVNDRVGEFVSTGGGEMKDFFTNIAPKVGVTAEMFRNLSGPQALQLYYSSLEKANLNQQEMTFYMESMADETTALIPLLRNNGQGFKEFGDQAERAGKVLSTIQIDRLVAVNQSIRTLETSFAGASNQLVVGLLPSIEQVTQHLNGMSDNGAMQALGAGISFLVENVNLLAGVLGAKVAASFISYASQVLVSTKATLADSLAVKGNALAKSEQAAAAAGLAAALATEASATVVTARATEEAALAKVRMLQAARDQLAYSTALAVGTAEEAKYTRALAATDVELTAAKKAAAQAGAQLGAVLTAESAALAKDTAATTAAAAAKTELAAASSLAARAGSGLLALLGGPVGIAALAVGAGIAFLTMRDNTNQAAISLDEMKAPLDQVIAKFKTLNEDQRKGTLVQWGEAQAAAAKTVASEFGNLASSIRAATVDPSQARLGGYSVQLKEYSELIARLKEAQANGQALAPILEGLRGKAGIDDAQINAWLKQAKAVSNAGGVLAETTLKLDAQTAALNANTAETEANNAAKTGMSVAGTTYLQTLQKQLDGLQDGGNATKIANRYIAEHTELTDTDKSSILAKAAAIEAAKEATKQATAATKSGTSAAKEAAAEAEKQAKALTDLKAQADIAISSATGLAAAYLAGTDKSREFGLQQKVEEALLKTGAAARAAVEKALKAQQDAQDKLNVSQSAYNLEQETTDLIAQAKATLQGAEALAAYNVQKAMTVALAGKNVEIGSQEYEHLLAATKAQQDAVKVAQQAANAGGIMERLYPEAKLLKDYTADQQALNAAMALYPQNAAAYQAALVKLGDEYEVNRSKATLWGQMTEGAIDRIDGVFADAWANIGSGADNLWDNLVKGAKQAFGEIAHMLTTKPLLASISNWLTGTDNGQGLSSVWGKLLGSAGGSSSESGGGLFGGLAGIGKNLYSAWNTITGVGSSVASGYASGGIGGAISGGAGYYSNMLSNIASTLSGGFTSLIGGNIAITGATAAGTAATTAALTGVTAAQAAAAAATVGAEGITAASLSAAVAEGAASIGTNIGVAGATTAAASQGVGAAISSAMSSAAAMWPLAIVMGMYQSGKLYDAGVRPSMSEMQATGGDTALGKATMAPIALQSGIMELTDKINSKLVGGKLAAIISGSTLHQAVWGAVGKKLFGGAWETKDGGISLGVENGEFDAQQYIYQKKKGGLFSSSKKRTRYSALDAETEDALGSAYNEKILNSMGLFSALGVQLSETVLDGLNVAASKISTKGKTAEAVQEELDKWFAGLGDSAV
ncbi:hypothetical protein, partial [Pseudomonas iridis]|uniref:hypothetical protein n=1 Tax=Pseudomonas iridis TaxID=2710587 RepID=UPI001B340EA9